MQIYYFQKHIVLGFILTFIVIILCRKSGSVTQRNYLIWFEKFNKPNFPNPHNLEAR
jgi:hypothetical protein